MGPRPTLTKNLSAQLHSQRCHQRLREEPCDLVCVTYNLTKRPFLPPSVVSVTSNRQAKLKRRCAARPHIAAIAKCHVEFVDMPHLTAAAFCFAGRLAPPSCQRDQKSTLSSSTSSSSSPSTFQAAAAFSSATVAPPAAALDSALVSAMAQLRRPAG